VTPEPVVAEEQRGAFQEFVSRAEAFASKSEPFLKLIPAGLGAIYLVDLWLSPLIWLDTVLLRSI
jgi:hypothetical protein